MTSRVWKKQSKREVDLQQREQARLHRTSSEAKKSGQKIERGECERGPGWEMGRWTNFMVCRVEGENGKWEKMWANLQQREQREQRDGPPSSGGGALGPPRRVCHQTSRDEKKKKKRGRGCGGEVGCEDEEEEDARRRPGGDSACWCGVLRRGLLAHLIQSRKKKKEIGRIQGWVGV